MEKKAKLFNAQVHRMCFDQDSIYTSAGKTIFRWDKKTKELMSSFVVPPNDNLNRGALICVDENNIYFNSIYFFHVVDKKTNKVIYQKQFGSDNSSDFHGIMLVDRKYIYFPLRNNGLVVVDKNDYENVRYLNKDKGSVWALDQDESMIYFGGVDKNIYAFNKSTLSPVTTFSAHKGNIHFIHSFKEYIVSVSADNSIFIWDKNKGSILHQIENAGCSLGRAIMTDKYIVCVAKNKIKIWDIDNWNMILEAKVFGTLFFDEGFIYLADRNIPQVAVCTIDDIIRERN